METAAFLFPLFLAAPPGTKKKGTIGTGRVATRLLPRDNGRDIEGFTNKIENSGRSQLKAFAAA